MRISIIDHFIWWFMASTCTTELEKARPHWDIALLRKKSGKRFRQILQSTPSIGSYSENSLRVSLNGATAWFAIFEVAKELYGNEMDVHLFDAMINAASCSPFMTKMLARKSIFTKEYQDKKIRMSEKDNRNTSEFNWHVEYTQGNVEEEFTFRYTKCGLCRLAQERGHSNILPSICRTDYALFQSMGAILHRNKTLADGDDCCHYYITKPGSKAEFEWQKQHPKESFIAK